MGSPQFSAWMLLASLIILYWTTSSTTASPPALYMVKREMPSETQAKTEKALQILPDALTVLKDVMDTHGKDALTGIMKNVANFASLAPGIGTLIASVINMILIFIPQKDPVLNAIKEGFAEVNRKLDSLSTEVKNLATDVEWFNYASTYSQHEDHILNGWKKFEEFFKKSGLRNRKRSHKIFDKHGYEQIEASVNSLYRYLTQNTISLSENLNQLLKRKFKCDVHVISQYNLYLSTLLWKGMVLKEVYWKQTHSYTFDKKTKHTEMFKQVYAAQQAVVESCLTDSEKYIMDDVKEIANAQSPDKKEVIAENVKKALDKKYSWYNWVVLVYDKQKEDKKKVVVYHMSKITIGEIIVAYTYTLKADPEKEKQTQTSVTHLVNTCFKEKQKCEFECSAPWGHVKGVPKTLDLIDFAKVTHATSHKYEPVALPKAAYQQKCWLVRKHVYNVFVYNSKKLPVCKQNPCKNDGQCKQLLNSNEWLCVCKDGYHGDTCDKRMRL